MQHVARPLRSLLSTFLVILLVSCSGYQSIASAKDSKLLQVPVIEGDVANDLRNCLIQEISQSRAFSFSAKNALYSLLIDLEKDRCDMIGYQDKKPSEGRLRVVAKVSVVHKSTKENLVAPFIVADTVDFDFNDAISQQAIDLQKYTLGQFSSKETASQAAEKILFQNLARKILHTLILLPQVNL